jgi:hypothetical protein
MRGFDNSGGRLLNPNSSGAESGYPYGFLPTATGFQATNGLLSASATFIYIAIRKGPMKVPTTGTSVFSPILSPDTDALGTQKTTNFPVDMQLYATTVGGSNYAVDRLRGVTTTASNGGKYLYTNATDAEGDGGSRFWNSTGFQISNTYQGLRTIYWNFRRAPSFFDEVCYTGNGTTSYTLNHNLTVIPELIIVKCRSTSTFWMVRCSANIDGRILYLNDNSDGDIYTSRFPSAPTATTFTVGTSIAANETNGSGQTYVAYLFATCAGVSSIGNYTGTGATLTISCGFVGGARFVLIKRTNGSGNWHVWDTARGMVSGTDPRLALNNTNAESNANWVFSTTGGFQIVTTDSSVNASGGRYIYLAIA